MAEIEVQLPDGRVLVFPEGTSQDTMRQAISRLDGGQQPAPQRTWRDALVDNVVGRDDGVTSFGENIGSFINRGIESATVGLVGDEAAAMADAAASYLPEPARAWIPGVNEGQTFDEALGSRRAEAARYAEDNPGYAVTADLLGAIAPGVGMAGLAARGATLGSQATRGILTGAAGGAMMGAMESERSGFNRLNDALVPTAVGGLLGAAMPAVAQGASSAWVRYGPGAAANLRRATRSINLDRSGAEIVGNAVARDAPYAGPLLREAGPDAVVAQMGPQTRGLLDAAINRTGQGASRAYNQVQELAANRGSALRGTLDDILGVPTGIQRAQRQLMENTAEARRAIYGAAYSKPIDYASEQGQALMQTLERLDPGDIARAERLLRRAGGENLQRYIRVGDDGSISVTAPPSVEVLDFLTRSLNEVGYATGAGGDEARIARDLSRTIRRQIDELVPEYRAARAEGRDVIANRDALEFGRNLLGKATEMDVAEDAIADMTDAEIRYARQGVRSYVEEVMANTQRAMTDSNVEAREVMRPVRELLTDASGRKLRALLGDEQAERLLQSARQAYSALNLRAHVGRGSPTQPRLQAQEVIDRNIPPTPMEAIEDGRGLTGALAAGFRGINGDPAAGRMAAQDQVYDRIAGLLMSPTQSLPGSGLPQVAELPGLLARAGEVGQRVNRGANRLGGILAAFGASQAARPLEERIGGPGWNPLRITID